MATRGSSQWKANISRGNMGKKHGPHSPETWLKISLANKGKHTGFPNPFQGKHHSPESRLKMSAALKGMRTGAASCRFGKHHSDEAREKIGAASRKRVGPLNPAFGRHLTEERRAGTSAGVAKAWAEGKFQRKPWPERARQMAQSPEANRKRSESQKKYQAEHPERRQQSSQRMKALWQDPQMRPRLLEAAVKARVDKPNKLESRIIHVIETAKLPYKYCGEGSVVIGFLRPDFINVNGEKKVIEVFGEAYHHPEKACIPLKPHHLERNRRKVFGDYGYQMLVLWGEEIKKATDQELGERIRQFNEAPRG